MKTLELTFRDVFCDAYGFRPYHIDFTMWNDDTFRAGIALCEAYIREREKQEASGRGLEASTTHD